MHNIIDTHAHLYAVQDQDAVLQFCAAQGLSDLILPGVDLSSNKTHLELCCASAGKLWPHLHPALGLHPGNITSLQDTADCLGHIRGNLARAIAVGEIGLDYTYPAVRRDPDLQALQREVFSSQLAIAAEAGLPVIIHSRGAWRDCLQMTLAAGISRAVFHWFSGPQDVLEDIIASGFMVSFSPALEFSAECRLAARIAPLERILLETDTPVAYPSAQGRRIPSTPVDIRRTLAALTLLLEREQTEVLVAVNQNARNFFGISA